MNTSLEPPLADTEYFINIAVGLVSLCIHSLLLLMASDGQFAGETVTQPQTSGTTATVWTEKETDALMEYLCTAKSKMGDSGTFKKQVFQAAAEHIKPLHTTGSAKTGTSCKTKYSSVSNFFNQVLILFC